MKKLITLALVAVSLSCSAQFQIVPGGLEPKEDPTKDYVIFEFWGMAKEDLFKRARVAITAIFKTANVMSYVEPDIISVDAATPNNKFQAFSGWGSLGITYNFTLRFRDGKIRVDTPSIAPTSGKGKIFFTKGGGLWGDTYHFWDKDGKPRDKETLIAIRDYVNSVINDIILETRKYEISEW